jgi:hypothetical protein
LAFSYWIDKPWFLTEGKLAAIFIKTSSWGFPTGRSFTSSTTGQQALWHYSSPRHHGSFLDVGSHRFYITKPFPEEVTDMLDPLCDAGLSYIESSDLDTMIEVMAHR